MELRSAFPLSVALGALLGAGIVAIGGRESSPAPDLAIAAVRTS